MHQFGRNLFRRNFAEQAVSSLLSSRAGVVQSDDHGVESFPGFQIVRKFLRRALTG
jgi:hypothetical protein